MKSTAKILLNVFLLLVFATFTDAQNFKTEKDYLNDGNVFLQKGEFQQAIAECNKAIALNPKSVAAFYLRGIARFLSQEPSDNALADFNKVIEIAPKIKDIEKVYNFRGGIYFLKKDNEKAFADYERAISINPYFSDPYVGRANILYDRGDFDKSLADYNKAIELNRNSAAAYIGRADIKFDRNDFDGALSDLDEALELAPTSAASHIERGIIYGLRGKWLASITDLRTGAEINAQSRSKYWGNLLVTLSKFDKYVLSNPKNANALAVRGFINLLRGKAVESETDFKTSFEIKPELRNELDNFIQAIKEIKR